jgi:hypothetical protein
VPSAGEVRVTFSADARQFLAAAATAQRATQQFESQATASFGRVDAAASRSLRGFESAALAAGAAVSGALVPALIKGYQRFTTIENATASLTRTFDSASKATTFMAKQLEIVQGTPFNFDQFADASSLLARMGIEAEKLPRIMTAIGEAAAGGIGEANQNLSQLSAVMARIATAGRISGDEVRSLSLIGVNAVQIFRDFGYEIGNTNRNFTELGIDGKTAIDILTKGILEGTENVKSMAGSMEDLRKNLEGAVGGFKAALARFGARIFESLQGDAKSLAGTIESMSNVLDETAPKMKELIAPIAKALERFNAAGGFRGIVKDMKAMSGIAPLIGLSLGVAAGGVLRFAESLPIIGRLIPPVVAQFGLIPAVIGSVLLSSKEGRKALTELGAAMRDVASAVAPSFFTTAAVAAQGFAQALIVIVKVVSPLLEILSKIPSSIFSVVAALVIFSKVKSALSIIIGRVGARLAEGVPLLARWVQGSSSASAAAIRQAAALRQLATAQGAANIAGASGQGIGGAHGFANLAGNIARTQQAIDKSAKSAGVFRTAFAGIANILTPMNIVLGTTAVIVGRIASNAARAREEADRLVDSFMAGLPAGNTIDAARQRLSLLKAELQDARAEANRLLESYATERNFLSSIPGIGKAREFLRRKFPQLGELYGNETAKAANTQAERAKRLQSEIGNAKNEVKRLDAEAKSFGDNPAFIDQANNAEKLNQALLGALNTVGGILQRSIAEFEEEMQKADETTKIITRDFGQFAAASRDVDNATRRYAEALQFGNLTSAQLRAEQDRLVEAYIRHRRATSTTAITESELLQIRQEAIQAVVDLTRQEQQARREREASNFSLIVSFNLLRDNIRTLESLQERGEDAAQSFAPDPSVTGSAFARVKQQINSLVDEFARRTRDNAKVLATFVANVNYLASKGHVGFAHELYLMGVEGADLAAEAVNRLKSGQGLGDLPKAMEEAAKAAKAAFDKRAVTWGANFEDMAGTASAKLAKVVKDEIPGAMRDTADLSDAELKRFAEIFNKNIEEYKRWVATINSIADAGMTDLAKVLQEAGPEQAKYARGIADAITSGDGLGALGPNVSALIDALRDGVFRSGLENWRGTGAEAGYNVGADTGRAIVNGLSDELQAFLNSDAYRIFTNLFGVGFDINAYPHTGRLMHMGGWVTSAHAGRRNGPGEVPAMLQAGEMVLSRQDVRRFGANNIQSARRHAAMSNWGGIGGGGGAVINIYASSITGRGHDDITESVRRGLSDAQFRNVDIGVRGSRR